MSKPYNPAHLSRCNLLKPQHRLEADVYHHRPIDTDSRIVAGITRQLRKFPSKFALASLLAVSMGNASAEPLSKKMCNMQIVVTSTDGQPLLQSVQTLITCIPTDEKLHGDNKHRYTVPLPCYGYYDLTAHFNGKKYKRQFYLMGKDSSSSIPVGGAK